MASIPRSSRKVLPSGAIATAQIPFDIADTGQGLEARALGAIGKGVGDVANVFAEIEARKQKATDLTQSGLDGQAQRDTQNQINLAENDVSINDRTKEYYEGQYESRFAFDESKYGTRQGAALGKIDFESSRDSYISRKLLNNSELAVKGAIGLTQQNYIENPTPENRAKYAEAVGLQESADGVEAKLNTADAAAVKLAQEKAIAGVFASIEATSAAGGVADFSLSKELAKNPLISEQKQATLRSSIATAEKANKVNLENLEKQAKANGTSNAIREYAQSKMTVADLDFKHEVGLISDTEYKRMRDGLTETIPDNSDPFAAGKIRRASADFEAGVITRAEADSVVAEEYVKLDGPDRSNVVSDLEDVATKIIGTARTNAYGEGRGLMSRQFVGLQDQSELLALISGTTGLTDKEKTRINRRFEAEISNRDFYERAVDDRFREMRKDKVSDIAKYNSESLRILQQYQRRKRLNLEALEAEITRETQEVIGETKTSGTKKIEDMTTAEKQAELQRIRELRRLAR